MGYYRRFENTYTYKKEKTMKAMTKDYFIQSEMMVITGLLEHVKDELEDTVFEDQETLDALLETLHNGCNIVVQRMKQIIREEDDEDDCCRDCC